VGSARRDNCGLPTLQRCDDRRQEAILGIDAAWTEKQPSGVALIAKQNGRWTVCAVAPSYAAFIALSRGTPVDWNARHIGSAPDPTHLIEANNLLLPGFRLNVVAVDMPMATVPIRGRREADNAISRAFWKQHCGVHSPSEDRPGRIGSSLVDGFTRQGSRLSCAGMLCSSSDSHLIEVYPHPALVALTGASERLKYKVSKARKFWPDFSPEQRRERVISEFERIEARLLEKIDGIALPPVPPNSPTHVLKAREDALDALVCAWVGMQYRAGLATAFGDETAAIWIPSA
jgi:predicted RNase H-like nuclease